VSGSGGTISLIIPVFNEQASIEPFLSAVDGVCRTIGTCDFQYIFIDDGSNDDTLAQLRKSSSDVAQITVIELSRNFGKEAALSAGIDHTEADAVIPIDVDLQDPPELIADMVREWQAGWEVVLASRTDRHSDSPMKRWTAALFYFAHNRMSTPEIPSNCGDFRLMDRVVVEALRQLPENQRFMKGLFAWVGFRTTAVEYTRRRRMAGASKFSILKLLDFAIQGFTSFSLFPLRLWHLLGLAASAGAVIFAALIIIQVLFFGIQVPGYASLMTVVLFLGGLQLIGIGVLGEYIGRSYFEAKRRPSYIIRRIHQPASD
jgi:glycosyltransferase involved in cell wall biosynthesis